MKLIIGCGLGMVISSGAAAQPFEIDWYTIDGGGGTSAGGGFELSGTIGQPDAGPTMTGGGFELTGGFWVVAQSQASRLCADVNQDGSVTPTDFGAWLSAFNGGNLLADANQDGSVTPTDFGAWLAAFNQGANGPLCNP